MSLPRNGPTERYAFAELNNRVKGRGVDYRKFGYSTFSKRMQDAAKRQILSTVRDRLAWYAEARRQTRYSAVPS